MSILCEWQKMAGEPRSRHTTGALWWLKSPEQEEFEQSIEDQYGSSRETIKTSLDDLKRELSDHDDDDEDNEVEEFKEFTSVQQAFVSLFEEMHRRHCADVESTIKVRLSQSALVCGFDELHFKRAFHLLYHRYNVVTNGQAHVRHHASDHVQWDQSMVAFGPLAATPNVWHKSTVHQYNVSAGHCASMAMELTEKRRVFWLEEPISKRRCRRLRRSIYVDQCTWRIDFTHIVPMDTDIESMAQQQQQQTYQIDLVWMPMLCPKDSTQQESMDAGQTDLILLLDEVLQACTVGA